LEKEPVTESAGIRLQEAYVDGNSLRKSHVAVEKGMKKLAATIR